MPDRADDHAGRGRAPPARARQRRSGQACPGASAPPSPPGPGSARCRSRGQSRLSGFGPSGAEASSPSSSRLASVQRAAHAPGRPSGRRAARRSSRAPRRARCRTGGSSRWCGRRRPRAAGSGPAARSRSRWSRPDRAARRTRPPRSIRPPRPSPRASACGSARRRPGSRSGSSGSRSVTQLNTRVKLAGSASSSQTSSGSGGDELAGLRPHPSTGSRRSWPNAVSTSCMLGQQLLVDLLDVRILAESLLEVDRRHHLDGDLGRQRQVPDDAGHQPEREPEHDRNRLQAKHAIDPHQPGQPLTPGQEQGGLLAADRDHRLDRYARGAARAG